MDYRNEWKHVISYSDMLAIRQRMQAIAKPDRYCMPKGNYLVRSLYFDTHKDKTKLMALISEKNFVSDIIITISH